MKISTIKNSPFFKNKDFYNVISFIILILLWKMISVIIKSEIIFPSPESTFTGLLELLRSGEFFIIIIHSLKRGLFGFSISLITGIIFGFAAGFNKVFYKIFEPFMVMIRTTPVIAVILIALVWFKPDNVPVFACFLMVFPIIYIDTVEGIKNVDIKLLQMAKIYNIRKSRVIREIYLPSLLPFLIPAISSATGIGWKVIIAAEVLSQPKYAIGTGLQASKIYLNINEVFAWTIVTVLLGYIFERIIRTIGSRLVRWDKNYVS